MAKHFKMLEKAKLDDELFGSDENWEVDVQPERPETSEAPAEATPTEAPIASRPRLDERVRIRRSNNACASERRLGLSKLDRTDYRTRAWPRGNSPPRFELPPRSGESEARKKVGEGGRSWHHCRRLTCA